MKAKEFLTFPLVIIMKGNLCQGGCRVEENINMQMGLSTKDNSLNKMYALSSVFFILFVLYFVDVEFRGMVKGVL